MERRRLETRLDDLVRDNRVTIAITFPLVGVVLLLLGERGIVPRTIAFHPLLLVGATMVMRLPLIGGLVPLIDRRGAVGLGLLACFAWSVELAGVLTGQPYGVFEYMTDLGPMLFGEVPLALPVFYFPILLNSYLLVTLLLGERARSFPVRWLATVSVVLLLDLVLDPGAVAIGFWAWDDPTLLDLGVVTTTLPSYYGVPVHNYLGWLFSASVAVALLTAAFDYEALRGRLDSCEYFLDDLISFGVFWGLVNLSVGNAVPVVLAGGLLAALLYADRFDFAGVSAGPVSSSGE